MESQIKSENGNGPVKDNSQQPLAQAKDAINQSQQNAQVRPDNTPETTVQTMSALELKRIHEERLLREKTQYFQGCRLSPRFKDALRTFDSANKAVQPAELFTLNSRGKRF